MRILLIHAALGIGGAETHLLELANMLKIRGVDVFVSTNGGTFVSALEENDIPHFKLPMHNLNPLNIVRSFFGLRRLVETEKIDLIHAHSRISAFISNFLDVPLVTTAHFFPRENWFLDKITKWGWFSSAVSKDIKDVLISRFNMKNSNVFLTVNGIAPFLASPVCCDDFFIKYGISETSKKIVIISRLEENTSDAVWNLFEIALLLRMTIGDLEIIIVGHGREYCKIFERASKLNAKAGRNFIVIVGSQTNVIPFLQMADVFIGVGRSALEAMVCEKIVILGGSEGYLGILEESKFEKARETNFCCRGCFKMSSDKLKSDILNVFSFDQTKRCRIQKENRDLVLSCYNVEKMTEDALRMYLKCFEYQNELI